MAGLSRVDGRDHPLLHFDLRAIWLVRSKVLFSELGFWLVLLGYDPRKRRLGSPVYFIYAVVFLAIWVLLVFLWLADTLSKVLTAAWLSPPAPDQIALALGCLLVLAFFFIELNQAVRRSPMVFSHQDAHLLCATPIDRRCVALAWFLEAWAARSAILWVILAALAGAVFQLRAPGFTLVGFFQFGQAALLAAITAAPLMMGVMAAAWAAGLWRLRGSDKPWLKWTPLLLVAAAAGLLAFGRDAFLAIAPLVWMIRAVLGLAGRGAGFLTAMLLAGAGLALVWGLSKNIRIAQAAQETQALHTLRTAALLGRADLVNEIRTAQRLGAGRAASRWAAGSGWRVFLWKTWAQARYLLQPRDLFLWAGLVSLNLGLLAFDVVETRLFMGLVWVMLVLQILEPAVQQTMSRWWLLRSLPLRAAVVSVGIILLPLAEVWLAGLAAWMVAWGMGWAVPIQTVWLYLALAPGVLLCGCIDVFQRARSALLNDGLCPGPELVGALGSSLLVGLFVGGAWLLFTYLGLFWLPALILLMLATGGVLFGLLRLSAWLLVRIQ